MAKLTALTKGPNYRFSVNDAPKCPHCGEDFDIAENEAWFLYKDDTHDVTCPKCENDFSVISNARWTFCTDEQETEEEDADVAGRAALSQAGDGR